MWTCDSGGRHLLWTEHMSEMKGWDQWPFDELNHRTFQLDNRHIAWICSDFLEEEGVPVLKWLPYSPDMEHVWDVLDRRVRQQVSGGMGERPPGHDRQPGDVHASLVGVPPCVRLNGGHTRYWSLWTWTVHPHCVLPAITPGLLFWNWGSQATATLLIMLLMLFLVQSEMGLLHHTIPALLNLAFFVFSSSVEDPSKLS